VCAEWVRLQKHDVKVPIAEFMSWPNRWRNAVIAEINKVRAEQDEIEAEAKRKGGE
jgi:hypothetical protein